MLICSCGLQNMVSKFDKIEYTVTPKVMELHGNEIKIEMEVNLPSKYVDKKSIMKFTPVLADDKNMKKLKTITIQGEEISEKGVTIGYATGGKFTYKTSIEYDESLQNSNLYATAEITVGSNTKITDKFLITEGIITTSKMCKNEDKISFANHGYEKETILSESAIVYFLVNQANIRKSERAGGDMSNLKKFMKTNNKTHSIEIISYASPEGSIDFNSNISDKRKNATFQYVKRELTRMKIDGADNSENYKLISRGEDWTGFNNLVSKSNMQDKQSVLNIVNSIKDKKKREEAIRDMSVIFETIEKDVLPKLRKAEIKINAYQPKKTDEEIKKLSIEKPIELTIEELLYAASTLSKDESISIYNFIIQNHPNDYRAYNNMGCLSMQDQNKERAQRWFKRSLEIKENDNANMNLAIIAVEKQDFESYKKYFDKVKQPEKENKGMHYLRTGQYKKAINNLEKGSYNYVLANVLSGNYNENCSNNNNDCNYLNAIIGARKGEKETVLKYLDTDKNKSKAKSDWEFRNYWDIIN